MDIVTRHRLSFLFHIVFIFKGKGNTRLSIYQTGRLLKMNLLPAPEFLLIILIIVTKSAPGHISEEGDKTCWMIDYIQKGNVNIDPMV